MGSTNIGAEDDCKPDLRGGKEFAACAARLTGLLPLAEPPT
jgi:hypothetical protein